MLDHHNHIGANVPEFRGTMSAIFQMEVNFYPFIATLGSGTGVVDILPLLTVSWRHVIETWVAVKGNAASSAVLRLGTRRRTGAGCTVHQRAAELGILAV